MRRHLLFLAALAVAGGAWAGTPVWVTSDVPADETLSGLTLLPWEIYRYDGAGYSLELSVPGQPDLNAIHRLDGDRDWLFSVEAPTDLGGALLPVGSIAEPRDLIFHDGGTGTYTLCFIGAASSLGPEANISAVTIEGGDPTCAPGGGTLLLSFDAPTDIPPFVGPSAFEPADLVRFRPLGVGTCPGWSVVAANPAFDASAAGTGIALSSIVEGADRARDFSSGVVRTVLALDVPSDVAPPAATYVPGQLIQTDTVTFSLFEPLTGWPIGAVVDGLSCGGNPGRVPVNMLMAKAAGNNLQLLWSPSCSQGADDYGIYEGTIGTWYGHTAIDCIDGGTPLEEVISPAAGDRYYLVVAHSGCRGEGSYGRCDSGVCLAGDERPVGTATCATPHVVSCCP